MFYWIKIYYQEDVQYECLKGIEKKEVHNNWMWWYNFYVQDVSNSSKNCRLIKSISSLSLNSVSSSSLGL